MNKNTMRTKVTFKIWKKGRKWIQCFCNYKDAKGERKSFQAKVLITESLRFKSEGDWVNSLPVEIRKVENTFTGKVSYEVEEVVIDNSSYVFTYGKHMFSNIQEVAEKDFFYLTYLASLKDLSEEVKDAVENFLSDYKITYDSQDFEYWNGGDYYPNQQFFEPATIEGYEFYKQDSREFDGIIDITNVYKKI